jgi:hypothetical protein
MSFRTRKKKCLSFKRDRRGTLRNGVQGITAAYESDFTLAGKADKPEKGNNVT